MTVITDLFVTIKDRYDLAERSLRSLLDNTERSDYRLTLCLDGSDPDKVPYMEHADYILLSKDNVGLGPTMNRALAHIQSMNTWTEPVPFITMMQDDVQYSPGWLRMLTSRFQAYENVYSLGFASGIECVEHPVKQDLGNGCILKDYIRATCMFARRGYWESMYPIPRIDPETRRERARPHDGIGSGVDWWFIRNHPNSVCMTGRTNLVIPGLLQHIGFDRSTWLKREMPESESDKQKISG